MSNETHWHYTDAGGLIGILRNKELWASSLGYLNDSAEVAFGLEVLKDALERYSSGRSPWPSGIPVARSPLDVYSVSFSTEGDLLSQWRGYAGGRGYALGFELAKLVHISRGPGDHSVEPYAVRYGSEAEQKVLEELTMRALSNGGELSDDDARFLLRNLPRYKHQSFAEEREWRLAILDAEPSKVDFRVREGRLLPYLPVAVPVDALTHVRLGPGATLADVAAVHLALTRFGWSDVVVDQSASPYR